MKVFWPCEGVLCPELCRRSAVETAKWLAGKASCDPNKVGRQSQGCVLALRGGPWPGAVQDES